VLFWCIVKSTTVRGSCCLATPSGAGGKAMHIRGYVGNMRERQPRIRNLHAYSYKKRETKKLTCKERREILIGEKESSINYTRKLIS
jgi:hypothetical protein